MFSKGITNFSILLFAYCLSGGSATAGDISVSNSGDDFTHVAAAKESLRLPKGMDMTRSGVVIQRQSGIKLIKASKSTVRFEAPGIKGYLRCDCDGAGACSYEVSEDDYGNDKVACRGDECCNLRMQSGFKAEDKGVELGQISLGEESCVDAMVTKPVMRGSKVQIGH